MAKKDTATLENQAPALAVTGSAQGQHTASTASASEPAAQKNDVKAGGPPSGFYIYLGPTIRGLRIKTPGNALHANYVKLVEQVKDVRRKEAAANG